MKWMFKIIFKMMEWFFIIFATVMAFPFIIVFSIPYGIIKACFGTKSKYSDTMSGQAYEQYCAKRLAREGYRNLSLTPDSGDFGADIIGYNRKGQKVCFQCKKWDSSVGVSAVQEVLSAQVYYDADKAVVLTNSTFTPAARKLAKSGDIELIERYM